MEPTLLTKYKTEIAKQLQEQLGFKNVHEIPQITKITLNSGFGNVDDRKQACEDVIREFGAITGQLAVPTKARLAISNFKLRAGDVIGARMTLRGARMWEFLDRFINVALPTVRDFRGVSFKSFDGRGNYSIGINDHTIFPEIELDKVNRTIGFDVTIVTTANTDDEARQLLTLLGMPFRKPSSSSAAAA
jgi:large subunit ribosomal protein L5